jgi:hypothetical protein
MEEQRQETWEGGRMIAEVMVMGTGEVIMAVEMTVVEVMTKVSYSARCSYEENSGGGRAYELVMMVGEDWGYWR